MAEWRLPSGGVGPPGKKQRREEPGRDGEAEAEAVHPQPVSAKSALDPLVVQLEA